MSQAKTQLDRETYSVHLDAAELDIQEQVGVLHRNLRKEDLPASFQYVPSWEKHPGKFMLDPRLSRITSTTEILDFKTAGNFLSMQKYSFGNGHFINK